MKRSLKATSSQVGDVLAATAILELFLARDDRADNGQELSSPSTSDAGPRTRAHIPRCACSRFATLAHATRRTIAAAPEQQGQHGRQAAGEMCSQRHELRRCSCWLWVFGRKLHRNRVQIHTGLVDRYAGLKPAQHIPIASDPQVLFEAAGRL